MLTQGMLPTDRDGVGHDERRTPKAITPAPKIIAASTGEPNTVVIPEAEPSSSGVAASPGYFDSHRAHQCFVPLRSISPSAPIQGARSKEISPARRTRPTHIGPPGRGPVSTLPCTLLT